MRMLADTHLHVYPLHNRGRLWTAAVHALTRLEPQGDPSPNLRAVLLAEAPANNVWGELTDSSAAAGGAWRFSASDEPGAGRLEHPEHGVLWIFAGRQVVTAERLEVLALTFDGDMEGGRPAAHIVEDILQRGGVPVLSWSPGKWMGIRGRCVAHLLQRFVPGELCVGDILLRPRLVPEPLLLRRARRQGFRILAGSDLLPVIGEETAAGRYASRLEFPFDAARPLSSLREALRNPKLRAERIGRRNGIVTAGSRMVRRRKTKTVSI